MESEKAEKSKRYNNSFRNILFFVEVAVVVTLLGYWCFPAIMNLLQAVTVWFDWFTLVLRNLFFVFLVVNVIIFLIYVSFSKTKTTGEKKPDLYDQYLAAVPPVVRTSPFDYYDILKAGDVEYYNNFNYRATVPAFQTVKAVEESSCTYDREVVEEVSSKSYRRTRSEKKKTEKKVEYRRTESERVTKTASWRSQTMDGLSSEEFRMTVETFITEKKKTLLRDSGVVDHWQNGVVPQWHNGVVNHLQNGVVPQWQNSVVSHWQNSVPEGQNGVVQWQRSRDDGSGRHRHGHRTRNHRLVGASGSNGSDSYLAISN